MSNSQGWISLHRKLLDNPIFSNYKLLQTFLYCLLKASHSDREQLVGDELVTIKTGQLVTGRKAISKATKLSEQNVRTALNRLEKLGILTIKPTNKYSIVTVVAWDLHQQTNQQTTSSQPTSNQQVTTNNNYNNVNNSNNKKSIVIPDGINIDSWTEWIDYRKEKKKSVSKAAAVKQFKLLAKYTEDQQKLIIDKSIESDYQGLFELKENNNEKNTRYSNGPTSAVERVRAEIAAELGATENNQPMGVNDFNVRPQMDEQLRCESGRGQNMASVLEGSYRDEN